MQDLILFLVFLIIIVSVFCALVRFLFYLLIKQLKSLRKSEAKNYANSLIIGMVAGFCVLFLSKFSHIFLGILNNLHGIDFTSPLSIIYVSLSILGSFLAFLAAALFLINIGVYSYSEIKKIK